MRKRRTIKAAVQAQFQSPLHNLHQKLKAQGREPSWQALFDARRRTQHTIEVLEGNLPRDLPQDVSVIFSGSLGRGEFTNGSDMDWSLLLDGSADPQHFRLAADIRTWVEAKAAKEVGKEGTFGGMVVSHDLIHLIGGDEDSNKNFTRRMLILLETVPLGPRVAFDRTFKNILHRYLNEDASFWRGTSRHGHHIPHFLMNDVTRFWRTMAVDFAYKLRNRGAKGAAIRNLKLRMSRKLLYVAGLLGCYRCHLDFVDDKDAFVGERRNETLARIESFFALPPTDLIASVLLNFDHLSESAEVLFNSYDRFLAVLSDDEKRERLEKLSESDSASDEVYQNTRQASRDFRDALVRIFFDNSEIGTLTRLYGVF